MSERPSQQWSRTVTTQEAEVAAGTLSPEQAYASELWPAPFTAGVDAVLEAYERAIRDGPRTDEALWSAVERAVLGLNALDEQHSRIETGEREALCEYLDAVLTGAGVDVPALTARHGYDRAGLTDEWREW
jgi:hypothetical protein